MKYALVTGSTSGLGAATAHRLASLGYSIVVVSNRQQENQLMAEQLRSRYGVEAIAVYADLQREEAAREIFDYLCEQDIEVEVLVSNAGALLFQSLVRTDANAIAELVRLHCTTPTLLCRLFAEQMQQRGRGHILIVSSITAWTPYPTISHYAATKAYLRSLGQSLWYELRSSGVSVTTIFPSAIDTPLYNLDEKMRRHLLRVGLMLSAEDVARSSVRAMLRRRRRHFPGLWTKVEAAVCAALPSWALLPVMKIPAIKRLLEKI